MEFANPPPVLRVPSPEPGVLPPATEPAPAPPADPYQRHLARMRDYNRRNADVIRERAKRHYQAIKADPERHRAYLERKRRRYKELNPPVVLPHKEFE